MHVEATPPPRDAGPASAIPPAIKLVAAVVTLAVISFTPFDWLPIAGAPYGTWIHFLLASLLLAVAIVCRAPWRWLGRRSLALGPLLLLLSASVPLAQGFSAGWLPLVQTLVRSGLSLATLLLLAALTPGPEMLQGLRSLRVPTVIVETLAFLYRFQFIVSDERRRLHRAWLARGGRSGWQAWLGGAGRIGVLLMLAFDRSQRVHAAMRARGYGQGAQPPGV